MVCDQSPERTVDRNFGDLTKFNFELLSAELRHLNKQFEHKFPAGSARHGRRWCETQMSWCSRSKRSGARAPRNFQRHDRCSHSPRPDLPQSRRGLGRQTVSRTPGAHGGDKKCDDCPDRSNQEDREVVSLATDAPLRPTGRTRRMLSGQTICVIAEATKTKPIAGNHQLVYPCCPEFENGRESHGLLVECPHLSGRRNCKLMTT